MRDLRTLVIPKVSESNIFEQLCYDLWKNDTRNDSVNLNGRSGQNQDGVDVFGRNNQTKLWFGIQCKLRNKDTSLSKNEITVELNKAINFNPSLVRIIICTTLDRDSKLQEVIRLLNHSNDYRFTIEICFWDDIAELLKQESNFNIYLKYYSGLVVDNTTLGHSIGKLINIELGVDGKYDTNYELMIGKIPSYKNNSYYNVDYFRDAYFIVNLNKNKSAVFKPPVYEGDIEDIFITRYDAFRIAKWINSIVKIDDFIYSDSRDYKTFITPEERVEYLNKYSNA